MFAVHCFLLCRLCSTKGPDAVHGLGTDVSGLPCSPAAQPSEWLRGRGSDVGRAGAVLRAHRAQLVVREAGRAHRRVRARGQEDFPVRGGEAEVLEEARLSVDTIGDPNA